MRSNRTISRFRRRHDERELNRIRGEFVYNLATTPDDFDTRDDLLVAYAARRARRGGGPTLTAEQREVLEESYDALAGAVV
jgi:hypothetical protein